MPTDSTTGSVLVLIQQKSNTCGYWHCSVTHVFRRWSYTTTGSTSTVVYTIICVDCMAVALNPIGPANRLLVTPRCSSPGALPN